jgi:MoaA/NifB/PqqE/SkfB family radical SAM enzyme
MNPRNSIAGWFFTDDQIAEALAARRMLNSSLDLSNACNLNCPYCFVEDKASARKVRRPDELSVHETMAVIDDFAAAGCATVNLVGSGEPTIDPHFIGVLQRIAAGGMTPVVFTNGIRFTHDPDLVGQVYDSGASVVLKYNSRFENVQDLVAGRTGYTQKRDKALELLLDAGFASHEPTRLGIDIIVFQGNVHEVADIHLWARSNNIYPIAGEYIPTGRTADGVFLGDAALVNFTSREQHLIRDLLQPITPRDRFSLSAAIAAIDKRYEIHHASCAAYFGGGQCTQILGLYVDLAGIVWPCVARTQLNLGQRFSLPLGNVRSGQNVKRLWAEHPYMNHVRSTFTGGCPYKAPFDHAVQGGLQ